HDPGGVDDDVDAAEFGLHRVEGFGHRDLVGDIAADGDGPAAAVGDRVDDLSGPLGVARVMDGDREAVGGQSVDHGTADAAGAAGDECYAGCEVSARHDAPIGYVDVPSI